MAPKPQSRGVETEEVSTVADAKMTVSKPTGSPTTIVKVISFGPGWMNVEMGDGNVYKREGGTLAWRGNNVGNIKYGTFAKDHGAVGQGHNGMAVFPTIDVSKKAMYQLLFRSESRYLNMTIKNAIATYAPDYDGNNSGNYCDYVCKHAKLSYTRTLQSLTSDEKDRMLLAMQNMEGSKKGTVSKVTK